MSAERPPPKHFSMLRQFHLADFITLGNAACGLLGVYFTFNYLHSGQARDFLLAAAMAPLAFAFDVADGKVARWRQTHSALGRELDSLADIISFGVAPAMLAYAAGMRSGLDWVVLTYFVLCGLSRLARFNVTAESLSAGADKVAYFEGTPIPTSIVLTGVLAYAAWAGRLQDQLYGGVWHIGSLSLHPFVLLFALSGTLMISKTLRIPKI